MTEQMGFPAWSMAPFVILLGCIAVFPILPAAAKLWERNWVKLVVALGLGVPTAIGAWLVAGHEAVAHSMLEYVQFIVLLASLFTVTGGIYVAGDIRATPRNNTLVLALGALLASFVGTTGAAMLLARPILNINREREYRSHTMVFMIFIVANCGGLLTPLGDPPLYVGLMRGVPFLWTFTLFGPWLFVNALLLFTYYALDRREYAKESTFALAWDEQTRTPISLRGASNIIWLAVIIASVALLGDYIWLKIGVQVAVSVASYLITNKQLRFDANEFTWSPIIEVAFLFIGIFLTMIPALEFLRENAHAMPLNEYTFFGFTGALSAVLDNTPTYLAFFDMAGTLSIPGPVVAGVPELYLTAISLGAVTCGAITYIGNGPNFMIKAVAEERDVQMPSFGRYVAWSVEFLVPILVSLVCLFISELLPVKIVGLAIAAVVVCRGGRWIVKNRLPSAV
jgi:Na+/H+ antiporter NhaD/arsenite permease-like protein